jgi:hypothetical protein
LHYHHHFPPETEYPFPPPEPGTFTGDFGRNQSNKEKE